MSRPTVHAKLLRFGPFEADVGARQLRKRGLRIKLRRQSLEVLVAFLNRPGEVVTREELRKRLWPEHIFVNFEDNLNSAVKHLRSALGESAAKPRYIETIPGLGYRLAGSVTDAASEAGGEFRLLVLPFSNLGGDPIVRENGGEASPKCNGPGGSQCLPDGALGPLVPEQALPPAGSSSESRSLWSLRALRQRWRALALGASALAVIAVAVYAGVKYRGTPGELKPVPLISMGGVAADAALSPDGNRVAFSWRAPKELSHAEGQDQCGIYVKVIGSGPAQRLTHGETDRLPAWSSDYRYIAFVRDSDRLSDVLLVPSIGGLERTVARIDVPPNFSSLFWTPDARWLVLSARTSSTGPYGIWLLSAETGEFRRLIPPPACGPGRWAGDFAGTLSRDGRTLAFARNTGGSSFRLYELQISKELRAVGEPLAISDQGYPWFAGAAWAANGDLVYSAGVNSRLWRAGRGRAPQLLNWAAHIAESPSISVSEQRLVFTSFTGNTDLWRLDLRTGEARMIVGSNNWQVTPQYSPDGRRVAFIGYRTGTPEIWTCNADGASCQQLTSFGGGTPRWSPDSRWLAVDSSVTGTPQIYVVAAEGGTPRQLTFGSASNQVPSWSHDGQWIYFESNRAGEWQLWKIPSGGGEAAPLNQTGSAPFESPDGKWVYFSRRSGRPEALFRMSVGGGDVLQVASKIPAPDFFSVTTRGVYFLSDAKTVQRFDPDSGTTTTVAKLNNNSVDYGMSVSLDGASMIFSQIGRTFSDIILVENYR
jgi:Tol biopolymer transport system component/DNA-binding winged helix-turn-helix (wHTH) protein